MNVFNHGCVREVGGEGAVCSGHVTSYLHFYSTQACSVDYSSILTENIEYRTLHMYTGIYIGLKLKDGGSRVRGCGESVGESVGKAWGMRGVCMYVCMYVIRITGWVGRQAGRRYSRYSAQLSSHIRRRMAIPFSHDE